MSYSTLPAPSDLFGVNSALRARAFSLNADNRKESDSHSPIMSEPRSSIFRPSLAAEFPAHLASLYNSQYAAVAAAVARQGTGVVAAPTPFGSYGRAPDVAAFYPSMVSGDAWRRSSYFSQLDLWPHLRSLEAVTGPRTKAPREATSILKSWLSEHKDNPYPTKSEKMTLALVTHMTLTQVSTWFANARRRIKKENKMTWTPRTRCGERDGSSSNDEENEKDYYGRHLPPFSSPNSGNSARRRSSGECDDRQETRGFADSIPSSSGLQTQDGARQHLTHPFFTAFAPGTHAQYGSSKGTSLQDGFRQRMLSEPKEQSVETRAPEGLQTSGEKRPMCVDEVDEDTSGRQQTSPIISQRMLNTDVTSPTERPRLHFEERRVFSKHDASSDLEESAKVVKSPNESQMTGLTKRDVNELSPPFSASSKIKQSPTNGAIACDDDESAVHDSLGGDSTTDDRKHTPLSYPCFYAAGGQMERASDNRNVEALSYWIQDFQRLLATGQENKARQALATALAVAAKAGARTGTHDIPTSYYSPERPDNDHRFPHKISPTGAITQNEGVPSPSRPNDAFGTRLVSNSDRNTSPSPDKTLRRSSSPRTSPAEVARGHALYRRPCRVSDDAPMNLSKPSLSNKEWTSGKITEDALIEA